MLKESRMKMGGESRKERKEAWESTFYVFTMRVSRLAESQPTLLVPAPKPNSLCVCLMIWFNGRRTRSHARVCLSLNLSTTLPQFHIQNIIPLFSQCLQPPPILNPANVNSINYQPNQMNNCVLLHRLCFFYSKEENSVSPPHARSRLNLLRSGYRSSRLGSACHSEGYWIGYSKVTPLPSSNPFPFSFPDLAKCKNPFCRGTHA